MIFTSLYPFKKRDYHDMVIIESDVHDHVSRYTHSQVPTSTLMAVENIVQFQSNLFEMLKVFKGKMRIVG